MGAPEVITAPSKSYVAIYSYKSTRSLPPTLCELGRVSDIAAAVTMSRSSNFVTRNNFPQSISSFPNIKRPISEVTDCSDSNSYHANAPSSSSTTDVTASHKKRRYTAGNQSSTSSLITPSTIKTDLDKSHNSNLKVKEMKLTSIDKSSTVSSPNVSSAIIQKINSVAIPQNTQRNPNTQASNSVSTKSPPKISCLEPIQISSPETGAHLHHQINQHARLYSPNTTELPNQQSVELPSPGMEQLPTNHSHTVQLQQQNQQLRNENVQLQKQLSLFRQLMKNPQRLNQVITRLEQGAQ